MLTYVFILKGENLLLNSQRGLQGGTEGGGGEEKAWMIYYSCKFVSREKYINFKNDF